MVHISFPLSLLFPLVSQFLSSENFQFPSVESKNSYLKAPKFRPITHPLLGGGQESGWGMSLFCLQRRHPMGSTSLWQQVPSW